MDALDLSMEAYWGRRTPLAIGEEVWDGAMARQGEVIDREENQVLVRFDNNLMWLDEEDLEVYEGQEE